MGSDNQSKLTSRLRKMFDDDDFVNGVLQYADTEEKRNRVLEFINSSSNVTDEDVVLFALRLES